MAIKSNEKATATRQSDCLTNETNTPSVFNAFSSMEDAQVKAIQNIRDGIYTFVSKYANYGEEDVAYQSIATGIASAIINHAERYIDNRKDAKASLALYRYVFDNVEQEVLKALQSKFHIKDEDFLKMVGELGDKESNDMLRNMLHLY